MYGKGGRPPRLERGPLHERHVAVGKQERRQRVQQHLRIAAFSARRQQPGLAGQRLRHSENHGIR